jgi:hypothetical protein
MSPSPRKAYRLTRDRYNNPLYTGRRRSVEEDEQNQQLSKFRTSFSKGISGAEGQKGLLAEKKRREGGTMVSSGDIKLDAADALFDLLHSKEVRAPTRGREKSEAVASPEKRKGVRT